MTSPTLRRRSGTLDSLRGLTLVSMMAYHACWDLVYLYGMPWDWYRSFWASPGSRASAAPLFSCPATAGRWAAIPSAGG